MPIISELGRKLARGHGAYSLPGTQASLGTPLFSRKPGSLRYSGREYLGEVVGSSAFTTHTYYLNPGLQASFPYLSGIAQNFEEGRFVSLIIEYVPTSGMVTGANTALGAVIMAFDYNANNPAYTGKMQMDAAIFSVSGAPIDHHILEVECKKGENPLDMYYVRTSTPPSGQDLRFYDLGTLQVATQGMQGAYNVGELWISYTVELKKPYISPLGVPTDYVHISGSPATVTNTAIFGVAPLSVNVATGALVGSVASGMTFTFPPTLTAGNYMLMCSYVGGSAVTSLGVPAYTNCVALNLFNNYAGARIGNDAATTTKYLVSLGIAVTGAGASFTLGGSVLPTSVTSFDVFMFALATGGP